MRQRRDPHERPAPRVCLGPQAAGAPWPPVAAGPRGAACAGGVGAAPL